jgi:peptide/nickel transport system permease protein
MLETMAEDYIRTARAKGLPERTVVTKHGMRAALTPIVTIFGLDLGGLLGGAILTEYTFGLQGLGKQALDGINVFDYPLIMGTTLFAAFFIILASIVVDVLYAVIDPRVRLS